MSSIIDCRICSRCEEHGALRNFRLLLMCKSLAVFQPPALFTMKSAVTKKSAKRSAIAVKSVNKPSTSAIAKSGKKSVIAMKPGKKSAICLKSTKKSAIAMKSGKKSAIVMKSVKKLKKPSTSTIAMKSVKKVKKPSTSTIAMKSVKKKPSTSTVAVKSAKKVKKPVVKLFRSMSTAPAHFVDGRPRSHDINYGIPLEYNWDLSTHRFLLVGPLHANLEVDGEWGDENLADDNNKFRSLLERVEAQQHLHADSMPVFWLALKATPEDDFNHAVIMDTIFCQWVQKALVRDILLHLGYTESEEFL